MKEEVEVLPTSVFVGLGCGQPADSEWHGEHCIWYHSYPIPGNHALRVAIAFDYGNGTVLS